MDWTKGRSERHYALYPPEEKARCNRPAQVNYRKRNANRLKHVGTVTKILKRQSSHHDDIPNLAAALQALLTDAGIKELRKNRRSE